MRADHLLSECSRTIIRRRSNVFPLITEISINPSGDPRELPAYGIGEASHYLGIPLATLRSWIRGRHYPTEAGPKYFKSVISLPDRRLGSLSFVNLVEAHVLDAIRGQCRIPLTKVRTAMDYLLIR